MDTPFGENTVTFDQAPFALSAQKSGSGEDQKYVPADVLSYLNGQDELSPELQQAYTTAINSLEDYIAQQANTGGIPNSQLITNIRVDGEFLSSWPGFKNFDTIGSTTAGNILTHGATDLSGIQLHSIALLTAFIQNPTFRNLTNQLTDLLGMIFDKNLHYNETDTTIPNFLEHLLRHEFGNAPGVTTADNMLARFTTDLGKLAQHGGGLLMESADITKALIAFAMQAYYDNRLAANATLYESVSGGISFDRSDVAATLDAVKGYDMYFKNYLETLPAQDRPFVEALLPNLLDWFIQTGAGGMTATAGEQAAFMLGGSGSDSLTGGSQADVLIGNNGADTLSGGRSYDYLFGGTGVDTYVINSGDGNDTIVDVGCNILKINGEVFAGVFTKVEGTDSYVFTSDDKTYTLTFGPFGSSTLTLDGSTSINFLNQTSAADFADGDFGIRLWDAPPDTSLTLNGTANHDEMGLLDIDADPANWQLMYTSFPAGSTFETPFFTRTLGAEAPRLLVNGDEGGDVLFGFSRHDEIFGGAGADIINGNLTFWNGKAVNLAGGAHADLLDGGEGDDIVSGDGYITGSGALTLATLSSLGITRTESAAGYYSGFTTNIFTLRHDAPASGDDILLGGGSSLRCCPSLILLHRPILSRLKANAERWRRAA